MAPSKRTRLKYIFLYGPWVKFLTCTSKHLEKRQHSNLPCGRWGRPLQNFDGKEYEFLWVLACEQELVNNRGSEPSPGQYGKRTNLRLLTNNNPVNKGILPRARLPPAPATHNPADLS